MAANNRIDFQVRYNVDQASINSLKKSLQDLQKIKIGDFNGTKDQLRSLKDTISQVQQALQSAFNINLGSLNVKSFNQQLQSAGLSVNKIYSQFSKAGAQGSAAFSQMTSSVLTTNLQLKQTKSLINSMGQTMANTVKWGIASSIMNQFTGAVKNAFSYVQSLDAALTDIRIVTGDSTQQMKQFAVEANNAAQSLGRSTMDYTKAALTFYQQGLDESAVQTRTEAVLKAQNITGAGDQMADYLTAVWNGYRVANEQAELYVDKLAAVADSSASNMSQLAVAMSKVASTARAMGVDVDSLNAQIATIVATTRQAPESVGNALKTIYARINDIATGADDAEVSLGNYSQKMAQVGFSVLDANGNLRDTGEVIEQIGGKWESLSREQQIYLARTMAGQRQYNNLIALFDNWSNYTDLVNVSLDSQGTLMQKNSRYMDSLGAKMQQLGAAGERFKSALIDEEGLKRFTQFGTGAVNLFANLIESIGGGGNALLTFGSILTQVFSGTISKEIDKIVTNINNIKNNAQILQNDITTTSLFGQSQGYQDGTIQEMVDAKKEIQQYYSSISKEQVNAYNEIVKQIGANKQQSLILDEQIQKYNVITNSIKEAAESLGTDFESNLLDIDEGIETLKDQLKGISYQDLLDVDVRENLISTLNELKEALGETAVEALPGFKVFDNILKEINDTEQVTIGQTNRLKQAAEAALGQVDNYLKINIQQVQTQAQQAQASLKMAKQAADNFIQNVRQGFDIKNIVQAVSSVGQLTAGFRTLGNVVKNVWSNENLSASQKLLQTLTGFGTAIPMILTSFNRLKTVTTELSGRFITFNDVQQKSTELQTIGNQLRDITISKQYILNDATLTAKQRTAALAEIQEYQITVKERQKIAQDKLNLAMKANPIGQIITVISLAIAGITALVKIYDALTMSTKQANQALDKFNDKQKQIIQSTKQYNQAKANLDPKEWEQLQKNAGAYNSTINRLTDAEKQRYYELSNLIAQYNQDAVSGYDEQGNAIIEMNHQLQETIALLKERHQLEIDETYGSKEAKQARRAQQVLFNDAFEDQSLAQDEVDLYSGKRTLNNSDRYNLEQQNFRTLIGQTQEKLAELRLTLSEDQTEQINIYQEQLNRILSQGFSGLAQNKNSLNELQENLKELAKNSLYENQNYFYQEFNGLKFYTTALEEANKNLQKANKEVSKNNKLDMSIFFGELQMSENNDIYNQAKESGAIALDSLLTGYVDGLFESGKISREQFKEKDDIYQQIIDTYINGEDGILTKINQAFYNIDYSGNQGLGINFEQYIQNAVQKLNNTNFTSYDQYTNTVAQFITNIINNNEAIKKLLESDPTLKESIEQYLANAFSLQNINWDSELDQASIKTTLGEGIDRLNQDINKVLIQFNPNAKIDITPYLNADLTRTELDKIIEKVNQVYDGSQPIKDLIQQIQGQVMTLSNVTSRINTIDLLNKQASGQDLSDDQLASLRNGINQIQRTFPNLQASFQILQQEWLQGTSIYQKSLQNVKNTILESFDLLKDQSGNLSDQIEAQLIGSFNKIITSSEDLQNITNKFLTTQNKTFMTQEGQEIFSEQLVRLASEYQNCTDEVNNYLFALNSMNQEAQQAAQFQLELALRSAENADATGLQAEQIQAVAQQMMKENMLLAENAELASDAATRYIRLNNAVSDIYQNLESYKSLQQEYNAAVEAGAESNEALMAILGDDGLYSTFNDLKQSTADLLDTNKDLLGDDWIVENFEKIFNAAEQGGQALQQLRQNAQVEILAKLGIDTSDFQMSTDDALAKINQMREGQALDVIGTADLDILTFIQQLVTAMQQAGMAQSDIQAALSGIGLDVDLAPYEEGLNAAIDQAGVAGQKASDYFASNAGVDVKTNSQTTTAEDLIDNVGYDVESYDVPGSIIYPTISSVPSLFGPVPQYTGLARATISYPAFRTVSNSNPVTATKQTTATGLQVIGATKSSGGHISHVNSPSRRAARSTPKSGSKGKSGGGSAKKPTIAKPSSQKIQTKQKTRIQDPYEQNTKQYQRQDKLLKTLEKRQKNIVNKDRLRNLQDQNKALQKQIQILQQRQKISDSGVEGSTKWYRDQIEKDFKKLAKFDEDGQIADRNALQNYAISQYNKAAEAATRAYQKQEDAYNKWITNVYNKASGERQQALKAEKQRRDNELKNNQQTAKDAISKAEEVYKKRIDTLNAYEKALDEDLKKYEEYLEDINQLTEQHIEEITTKVQIGIDIGDLERDWLDFENKFIKKLANDDIIGNAKASIKELMSYINSQQIQANDQAIRTLRKNIQDLQKGNGYSELYGISQEAYDKLDKKDRITLRDNTLDKLENELNQYSEKQRDWLIEIQQRVDDIKDSYLDAIDEANDKMKDQVDQYERINSLIDHDVKLLELLYGDKAYDTREKYYDLQKKNNQQELESLRQQQQFWQDRMNQQVVGSDAWKKFKDNLDSVTDDLNSKLEQMIQNLSDQWQNRVDGIIEKLNNSLTGGLGTDYLDEQWDYINDYDDKFLDTFNSTVGVQEVENLYNQAIEGLAGNPKAQQRINNLMKDQLKILKEKDVLTEYDLERAKAMLQVEQARMDLEDARNNKTKMRLRRDSQGNYTYQYVADEEQLGELEQALADAQANLYNTDKDHYKQNLNDLYDTYKDYLSKMKDLTAEYNATQDEQERARIQNRIDLLKESQQKMMQGLLEDNDYLLKQYLTQSYFDGMGIDTANMSLEEMIQALRENVPQAASAIQDLGDSIRNQGGLLSATADAVDQINQATEDHDKAIKEQLETAGTSLQTISNVTDDMGQALDSNITAAQNLLTTNQMLIESCRKQIEAMQDLLSMLDQYLNKAMNVEQIVANLRSAYNIGQILNGSSLTADEIPVSYDDIDTTFTDEDIAKAYYDYLKSNFYETFGLESPEEDLDNAIKEFVDSLKLNDQIKGVDIESVIRAADVVQGLTSALGNYFNTEVESFGAGLNGILGNLNTNETLDQNVHIDASFPNASNAAEIEAAFNNLINMASMYASKNKD